MSLPHHHLEICDFSCPRCHGPMAAEHRRLRCESGHAYTPEELLLEAQQVSASAAWEAVRALENRDRIARWALEGEGLTARQRRAGTSAVEAQTAETLRFYARAIDANTPNFRPDPPRDQRHAAVLPFRGTHGATSQGA